MRVKEWYTAQEKTRRLLELWQTEADSYNDLSPEQEMAEMAKDPAYIEFIENVNEAPF